ncbi:uncharacterized protein [Miscanthus floridulus]|uniref:uncharacterized protein isoform X2 n=1 Tax=Miscanthus floridulus TaxID=154761 RepID=UPI00345B3319
MIEASDYPQFRSWKIVPFSCIFARKCSIPFGSFVSDLYSKSGDLALSVQLWNDSNLPINKKKKQNALREVRKALLSRGVTGYMQFIPHARVPVLHCRYGFSKERGYSVLFVIRRVIFKAYAIVCWLMKPDVVKFKNLLRTPCHVS